MRKTRFCNHLVLGLLIGLFFYPVIAGEANPAAESGKPKLLNVVHRHEMVAMRDGIKLGTYIWQPEGEEPRPTLLQRHGYGIDYRGSLEVEDLSRMASHGYVVIHQDSRGRYTSEGVWDQPLRTAGVDGEDTINWIAEQSWSNGKVAMIGASYGGMTQLYAANRKPEALVSIIPFAVGTLDGATYASPGVPMLGSVLVWPLHVSEESLRRSGGRLQDQTVRQVIQGEQRIASIFRYPLSEYLKGIEPVSPWVRDFVEHSSPAAPFWQPYRDTANINVPVLMVTGWYDYFVNSAFETFASMTKSADWQERVRMLVLPVDHGRSSFPGKKPLQAEFEYPWQLLDDPLALGGASPSPERSNVVTDWLAFWLKNERNDVMNMAPIQIYVMGENRMRGEYEWPLARTQWRKYYLRSEGSANSLDGNGYLSLQIPGSEQADHYNYDPVNPVPTLGGRIRAGGPLDQRKVEQRDDVLVYSTAPLLQDVEVTGPVSLKLWVATSAVDTDFTGKLVDVYPDGAARILCDGVTRLRFHKKHVEQGASGEFQEIEIKLGPTSNLFKKGHRIRLEVSSSNFPYIDTNPNTGKSLFFDETNQTIVAHQTVFHDQTRPSHLALPVIPRHKGER